MPSDPLPPLGRLSRWLIGGIVALPGLGLIGFALVLVYADWLRELPSQEVVVSVISICALGGLWCALVGLRLLSGRPTPIDPVLLSPLSWRGVGVVFLSLALWLLLGGRIRLALPLVVFGLLCLLGARAMRFARARWTP